MELEILFQDKYFVAINKPHGLLVHRSFIASNTDVYALQLLRNQLNMKVYPAHRIDRKTGGVLLFSLDENVHKLIRKSFEEDLIYKSYLAIVRGHTDSEGIIDYPLLNEKEKLQNAVTSYKTLIKSEIPVQFGKFSTSRYSLVEVYPQTGRMHQIRKHFAHIFHPIIGDRPHGCNKQNKLFLETWNMNTMLLHARMLKFIHPITNENIIIKAPLQSEFLRMIEVLKLNCSFD